jgi:hypothetical protein
VASRSCRCFNAARHASRPGCRATSSKPQVARQVTGASFFSRQADAEPDRESLG